MGNNNFSIHDTNILKGIAILIIVCHHVFWKELFVDSSCAQIFILGPVSGLVTRWGFTFNHVFAALTGVGLAVTLSKLKPFQSFLKRELSIIFLLVPVYILAAIGYIIFNGGFVAFSSIYCGKYSPILVNILLDMGGVLRYIQVGNT